MGGAGVSEFFYYKSKFKIIFFFDGAGGRGWLEQVQFFQRIQI